MEYLSSLGKSQTAAVKRDADIGVAQANRDAGIRVGLSPPPSPPSHTNTMRSCKAFTFYEIVYFSVKIDTHSAQLCNSLKL